MQYQFPLTAINRKGETRIFNDAESFRKFAFDRTNGGVGAYWMEARGYFGTDRNKLIRVYQESTIRERWYPSGVKNNWIVRDNRGRPVDSQDFYVPYVWPHGYRWTAERQKAAENGLPIPGTGKRRRRKCHCREACGGSHRDARYRDETAAENAAQNGFEGL